MSFTIFAEHVKVRRKEVERERTKNYEATLFSKSRLVTDTVLSAE